MRSAGSRSTATHPLAAVHIGRPAGSSTAGSRDEGVSGLMKVRYRVPIEALNLLFLRIPHEPMIITGSQNRTFGQMMSGP